MGVGKKGFLLTLLAIILSSFFVVMFSARTTVSPDYNVDLIESRVMLLDHYSENFFSYAKSATVISGYSGLQSMVNDAYLTRSYKAKFKEEYALCVKIGNATPTRLCPNMTGKTLDFYLRNLTVSAQNELKIKSAYSINNISVGQTQDPFLIELTVNLTLNVTDQFAQISNTRIFTSFVPITGIIDPIYALNGTYNQTIKKGNITKTIWTAKDLEQIYRNHEYRVGSKEISLGVSFINRMEGNFTNTSLGIESIVNHTRADVIALYNSNLSLIDHLFWTNKSFDCRNMEIVAITRPSLPDELLTPSFQLDDIHRMSFNITNDNTTMTVGCI